MPSEFAGCEHASTPLPFAALRAQGVFRAPTVEGLGLPSCFWEIVEEAAVCDSPTEADPLTDIRAEERIVNGAPPFDSR